MPIQLELESSRPSMRPLQAGRPYRTFMELLRSKEAPLDQLVLLKKFAKANLNHPENKMPRPIFTVIYYASIAAALSQHGKKITSLGESDLREGLEWGAQLPWIGPEVESVLRAGLNCLDRGGKEQSRSAGPP